MHQSGKWHLDVNGDWPVEWQRPPDLALHRKRAFAVVQHIGMAVVNEPPVERAVLHLVPANTDRTIATAFDVWIEDPDTDHAAWPGKDAGTTLIGTAVHRRRRWHVLRRRRPGAAGHGRAAAA